MRIAVYVNNRQSCVSMVASCGRYKCVSHSHVISLRHPDGILDQ